MIHDLALRCCVCKTVTTVHGAVSDLDPRVYRCLQCRPVKVLSPTDMAVAVEWAQRLSGHASQGSGLILNPDEPEAKEAAAEEPGVPTCLCVSCGRDAIGRNDRGAWACGRHMDAVAA